MRRSKPFKHKCAAFGCKSLVPYRFLMCQPHWRLVPPAVQRDVYAAWNEGVKTAAWTKAVSAAIAATTYQSELFG